MKINSPRLIRSRLALNPKKVDRFDRFDAKKNYENWIYLARGGTIICDPLLTNDQRASYRWSRSQNNFKMKVLITITLGAQDWSVMTDWLTQKYFQMFFIFFMSSSLFQLSSAQNDLDFWNVERPPDMANIASLEVMCGKTHMEVQISFDRPFNGIIFSKGAIDQYNCIYVKPQTGSRAYSFKIMYDQVRSHSKRVFSIMKTL